MMHTVTHDPRARSLPHTYSSSSHLQVLMEPNTNTISYSLISYNQYNVFYLYHLCHTTIYTGLYLSQSQMFLSNVLINIHTTLPTPLRLILTFHRSRADPGKGWTLHSYPGDSQFVLVALLLIGIVD